MKRILAIISFIILVSALLFALGCRIFIMYHCDLSHEGLDPYCIMTNAAGKYSFGDSYIGWTSSDIFDMEQEAQAAMLSFSNFTRMDYLNRQGFK